MTRMSAAIATLWLCGSLAAISPAEELRNDGWETGQPQTFLSGFVAGEIAAARLVPAIPGSHLLQSVRLMFGGSATATDVILHIWDDAAGTAAPGAELFSDTVNLLPSSVSLIQIDLTSAALSIDGPIRVGIEFTIAGLPCVGRDDDGTIDGTRNFIYSGGTWYASTAFGVTGDWIIRAETDASATTFSIGGTVTGLSGALILQNNGGDDLTITGDGPFTFGTPLLDGSPYEVTILSAPPGQVFTIQNGSGTIAGADVTDVAILPLGLVVDVLENDGWLPGETATAQAGFAAGEIAAARFVPANADPWTIEMLQLVFGGSTDQQTVTVKVWQDEGGSAAPGAELYAGTFQLTGGDALQAVDLGAAGLTVSGGFRLGLQFQHTGLPSICRDDDGITPGCNFIYTAGAWYQAETLGVAGDWILRAVVSQGVQPAAPVISAVADLPYDQGHQVRIAWTGDGHDSAGSAVPITAYALFRRIDPGYKTYPPGDWEYLKTVPAFQEAQYATVAPTVADSTIADGMHYTAFFVRAMTAQPGVYFDSAPDSGYSLDNLVPQVPQELLVAYAPEGGNALSWQPCPDADFAYFKVYRGTEPDFDVQPAALCHVTTDAGWLDTAGGYDSCYKVAAVDVSGNESAAAIPQSVSGAQTQAPRALLLDPCRPNPFNPSTTIAFSLPRGARTTVDVFDARGRRVARLLDAARPAGPDAVTWDGRDDAGHLLPGGVYLVRVRAGGESRFAKAVLVK